MDEKLRTRDFFFFCFFCLVGLAAFSECSLFALGAARVAFRAGKDINDDAAVVLAAFGARAMRYAQRAALARGESLA